LCQQKSNKATVDFFLTARKRATKKISNNKDAKGSITSRMGERQTRAARPYALAAMIINAILFFSCRRANDDCPR
jgi:hypothetical protein